MTIPDIIERAPALDEVRAAAQRALLEYIGSDGGHIVGDSGPAVLAGLLADTDTATEDSATEDNATEDNATDTDTATGTDDNATAGAAGTGGRTRPVLRAAVATWVQTLRPDLRHAGIFDEGLASALMGLKYAAPLVPGLDGLAGSIRSTLRRHLAARPWKTTGVGWSDYDLITGPAGTVMALAADPHSTRADIAPAVTHLSRLCARADLDGLRAGEYRDDPYVSWNHGRINTGLAHGVPGVTAALVAAVDRFGADDELVDALGHTARWLAAEAYTDPTGLVAWHSAGREGGRASVARSETQAWCYGTPGISWTLWEAGRVLGDAALTGTARAAFESFLATRGVDDLLAARPGRSAPRTTDLLAMCHGGAGVMMVCDAFHRHAGVAGALARREDWHRYLRGRLADLVAATTSDAGLIQGTTGAFAAMLTVRGGDRSWLALFGLR